MSEYTTRLITGENVGEIKQNLDKLLSEASTKGWSFVSMNPILTKSITTGHGQATNLSSIHIVILQKP